MKLVSHEDFNLWWIRRSPKNTIDAKAEYARLVARCDYPAWEFLKFLEKEANNFRTANEGKRKFLVWKNGELPFRIEKVEIFDITEYGADHAISFKGISWATLFERTLLNHALARLFNLADRLTEKDEKLLELESFQQTRNELGNWLEEQNNA